MSILNKEYRHLNSRIQANYEGSEGTLTYPESFVLAYFDSVSDLLKRAQYIGSYGTTSRRQEYQLWSFGIKVEESLGEKEIELSLITGKLEISQEPTIIARDEVLDISKKGVNFFKSVAWIKANSKHQSEVDLASQIQEKLRAKQIKKIRLVFLTNNLVEEKIINKLQGKVLFSVEDINVTLDIWDLRRRGNYVRSEDDFSIVSVDQFEEAPLIVKANVHSDEQGYVTSLSGLDVFKLYDSYRTDLLQQNVRVFLSATRKANKEMINTLRNEPEKFFFYNNGLSITCSSVQIENERIVAIKDIQIVNGGQTTATIHYAKKKYRDIDLSKVKVQVRLIEIEDKANYEVTVNKISVASNTQSVVSPSDFMSNAKIFTNLESLISTYPINTGLGDVFYFFERMKGQKRAAEMQRLTQQEKRAFLKMYPKSLTFSKLDFARWWNTYSLFPHVSASGSEKQFKSFMNSIESRIFTKQDYFEIVGFGRIFTRIRTVCGTANGREFPSLIEDSSVGMSTSIYASSVFHQLFGAEIEYLDVFDNLFEENYFDEVFKEVIMKTWSLISEYGGTSVQEQTKKIGCWEFVQNNINSYSQIEERYKLLQLRKRSRQEIDAAFRDPLEKAISCINVMFTDDAVRDDLLSYGRFRRVVNKINDGKEVSLDLVLSSLDRVSVDLDFAFVDRIKEVFSGEFKDLNNAYVTTGLIDTASVRHLIDRVN
jgi:hypothetical protein